MNKIKLFIEYLKKRFEQLKNYLASKKFKEILDTILVTMSYGGLAHIIECVENNEEDRIVVFAVFCAYYSYQWKYERDLRKLRNLQK